LRIRVPDFVHAGDRRHGACICSQALESVKQIHRRRQHHAASIQVARCALGLSDHDGIDVFQRLFHPVGNVRPSRHHRHTRPAIPIREGIGFAGETGEERDG
jgi:hypothetical protein